MSVALVTIALLPVIVGFYAYVAYPAILWINAKTRSNQPREAKEGWPAITITVPVYNAASTIRATLERLLELDYPQERIQLLVISDASTDGTDDIAREFSDRGVELLRLPHRKGKTVAENAAVAAARANIIVNVDGSVLVPPGSLKPLIRVFDDQTIGVSSGRDISAGEKGATSTGAESAYVGYEMWVRDLETTAGSIVGASGCFYAIRRGIHEKPLPPELSWDFASPLVARLRGYRSVSVPSAVCIVPRTDDLRVELKRKARTMARGIRTLLHHRALMNPIRYRGFALMLISHKLMRWVPYLVAPLAIVALGALAANSPSARALFSILLGGIIVGSLSVLFPRHRRMLPLAVSGFAVAAFAAGFLAWCDALRNAPHATWDPTPRRRVGA